MSNKNSLAPIPIVTNQSMAANFATLGTNLLQQDNGSYQIVVQASGSSGQFYLDGSDDINTAAIPNFQPTNWTQIMQCGNIAGANDTILLDVNQWPHVYARIRYVSTVAGAGTCSIILTAKRIG